MAGEARRALSTQAWGLAASFALCFAAAALGGAASIEAGSFYAGLQRPDWAPPGWLFGPVWTTLYALMAFAAWWVWRSDQSALMRRALVLFVIQLVVNALWSWLFFVWHLGGWAFLDTLVLAALVGTTMGMFWRIRPLAGVLLLPYLVWVCFAAALNFAVWTLNPGALG